MILIQKYVTYECVCIHAHVCVNRENGGGMRP